MHCCTGNAAQTVYYLWKSMMQSDDERLRINLLLNRASTAADVYSYVPYEGRVDVKVKQATRNVLVRMKSAMVVKTSDETFSIRVWKIAPLAPSELAFWKISGA